MRTDSSPHRSVSDPDWGVVAGHQRRDSLTLTLRLSVSTAPRLTTREDRHSECGRDGGGCCKKCGIMGVLQG